MIVSFSLRFFDIIAGLRNSSNQAVPIPPWNNGLIRFTSCENYTSISVFYWSYFCMTAWYCGVRWGLATTCSEYRDTVLGSHVWKAA